MYEYRARCLRVIDGDTIHSEIDLGLDIRVRATLRLAGINAPERGTSDGDAATLYLKGVLQPPNMSVLSEEYWFIIRTTKDRREKYGRYLADIYVGGPDDHVNAALILRGHATPYKVR